MEIFAGIIALGIVVVLLDPILELIGFVIAASLAIIAIPFLPFIGLMHWIDIKILNRKEGA